MSVYVAACKDYDEAAVLDAVSRIMDSLQLPDFQGKRVLVKPNLVSAVSPDAAATTHPTVVFAVCRCLVERGASVVVADSPGGVYSRATLEKLYRATGMAEAVSRLQNVELGFDTSSKKRGGFNIFSMVDEADYLVNVAKLKTHGLAYYTGATKNLFGCIHGYDKAVMHSKHPTKSGFCAMLVDLCQHVRPVFSIVDGVVGMEGAGPTAGTPKHAGVIGGSVNPYELDYAMCEQTGLPPRLVPVLVEAERRGLLARDFERLGDKPPKTRFQPAISSSRDGIFSLALMVLAPKLYDRLNQKRSPFPTILSSCVGCGKCAEVCPRGVITVSQGRAVIDKSGCIKCYCCHEFCPKKAIEL